MDSLLDDQTAAAVPAAEADSCPFGTVELGRFVAAFLALAFRYTGETEAAVRLALKPRKGPISSTDLACSLEPQSPLRHLLDRVRAILDELGAGWSADWRDWRGAELSLEWLGNPLSSAKADGSLRARMTLSEDPDASLPPLAEVELSAPAEIVYAGQHWLALASALDRGGAETLAEIPLVAGAELARLLGEWRGQSFRPELARRERLPELFEAQARLGPERIAIQFGAETLTYAQVEAGANRWANRLRAHGIGPGQNVGLLAPRSPDLYLALLAILKTGAAYVPLDPEAPAERVAFMLADCQARALVTTTTLTERSAGFSGLRFLLDAPEPAGTAGAPIPPPASGSSAEDTCYIIYTSGSTGQPKGVPIDHRAACNLVRAEGELFGVRPGDRVYQGFSLAFDASVEEIWLAFFAGATLVPATREMARAGADLPRQLTEAGVTVLSCVPTLLAMFEDDLPSVRLLILGGELCPSALAARWAKPGRRMVNTYGPTEATVIATSGECGPERPITIGRPLPNYHAYILDPRLAPVPIGVPGELCLAGIGIARGYLGRPELTGEKFVPNPFAKDDPHFGRLYRTGDRVRFNPDGEIEFLGRIDSQVKLRGFRVELGEIETILREQAGVLDAVVALREDPDELPRLVGYVVMRREATLDETALRAALRDRLPAYMVPSEFEGLTSLPRLPSGKVDRRRLPAPMPRRPDPGPVNAGQTDAERKILAVWQALFRAGPLERDADFFLDLGGHSLLAAQMVSQLRKDPQFASLSMLDAYEHPTAAALAAALTARVAPPAADSNSSTSAPPSSAAFTICGAWQAVGLYFAAGFFSLQWLAPYLTYTWMRESDYDLLPAIVGSLASLLGLYPLMLLATIAVKWLVIGRYRAGEYPLWSFYYARWWFVNTIISAVPVGYLTGTPLLNWYYRLMGARVGVNVHLGSESASIFDLLSIGDDTCVGVEANLGGYTVEAGKLRLGPITIGRRCFVGARAVVREGARIEDDGQLDDLSLLRRGETIPRGECWRGSPGRPTPRPPRPASPPRPSLAKRLGFGLLHAVGLFIFPVFVLSAIFPGMMLMNYLNYADDYYWYLFLAPPVALSFVVLLGLEIAAIKWLFLGRVKPGRYPLQSSFYFRKWFVDQLLELSLDVLGPLYATIYLAPWYRLLGAKLGPRAEISTASFISPDLLTIGEESFIADSVSLGAARVEDGAVTIGETRIGRRSFVGNSACLPPGTKLGSDSLIGCLSAPPTNPDEAARDGASWLGSPAIFLPQRQASAAFPVETTFQPTRKMWWQRAAIEFIRVILPSTCFIILTSLLMSVVVLIEDDITLTQLLLLFPILYAACGIAATLFTVALKWALVGRYKPGEKPLWTTFVWRTELVTSMHENLADLFFTNLLTGTPYLAWFFRLLGAKIGRRVYMETTDLTEYDLVSIGDDAILNVDCTLQTHLFEDRVMKMSTVEIGPGCTVGSLSLVLYDTRMEPGASLGDLSLLMKGEILPAGTRWEGIPSRLATPTSKASATSSNTEQPNVPG